MPVFLVRCGLDAQFINMGLENFIQAALVQDIRLQVVNYLHGMHAFDAYTNSGESRSIIKQTVAFLQDNLTNPITDTQFTLTNRNFMWMAIHGQMQKAVDEFKKAREMYRHDTSYSPFYNAVLREQILNSSAYWLLQNGYKPQALETFKLVADTYPQSANAYDGLADGYEAMGNKAEALKNARAALQKLEADKSMAADFKERLRANVMQKIDRLK